jgi:hypothetical protein
VDEDGARDPRGRRWGTGTARGCGIGGGDGIDCLMTSADDVANPGLREIGG